MDSQAPRTLTESQICYGLLSTYPNFDAASIGSLAKKLAKMDADLQAEFANWWHSGVIPTISVEGYCIADLMATGKCFSPAAAFGILAWLRRDPEQAKTALQEGPAL